jgi:hypothetical protein
MAANTSLNVNHLTVRNIYALNSSNSQYIQPGQIPMIGTDDRGFANGVVKWYNSEEFLNKMYISSVSSTAYEILASVQPAISSMSTIQSLALQTSLQSTVRGLGNAGYVSTSYLDNELAQLSYSRHYISATTLYDCIANLGSLGVIGNNLGPMSFIGSNFSGGYISTLNPGEYRIYKSSIGIEGSNLSGKVFSDNTSVDSVNIRIAGFSNHIVNNSKMTVDVMANMNLSFSGAGTGSGTCYFSTCLSAYTNDPPRFYDKIGDPLKISLNTGSPVNLAHFRCILSATDLSPFPQVLTLRHTLSNSPGVVTSLNTYVPEINGIFVTLDNTD